MRMRHRKCKRQGSKQAYRGKRIKFRAFHHFHGRVCLQLLPSSSFASFLFLERKPNQPPLVFAAGTSSRSIASMSSTSHHACIASQHVSQES